MSPNKKLFFQLILVIITIQAASSSCKSYDYYYNGQCYDYCPRGTYSNYSYASNTSSYICLDCPSECAYCSRNSTTKALYCTSCRNGLGATATGGCHDVFDVVVKPTIALAIYLGAFITLKIVADVLRRKKLQAGQQGVPPA